MMRDAATAAAALDRKKKSENFQNFSSFFSIDPFHHLSGACSLHARGVSLLDSVSIDLYWSSLCTPAKAQIEMEPSTTTTTTTPSIELRSDTFTQPTAAMRTAMLQADCGDDVWGEDETVKVLERRAALLTGKPAALWVPTGTMGNLSSLLSHCSRRGEEVIVGKQSHIYQYEAGGASVLGGIPFNAVDEEERGTLPLASLRAAVRRPFGERQQGYGRGDNEEELESGDPHSAPTRLICLETTHNRCGGAVLPLSYLREVRALAHELGGLKIHLDGARLFNAAVSSKLPVSEITQHVDSVTFCLSKGLGAPAGSVLCGEVAFIARARRFRKMLGGGLRQVGVLAAPGLVALGDEQIGRLSIDHANARRFAEGVRGIRGLVVDGGGSGGGDEGGDAPETNIVVFGFSRQLLAQLGAKKSKQLSHEDVVAGLKARGVKIAGFRDRLRAVTCYEVSEGEVERAVEALREVVGELLLAAGV